MDTPAISERGFRQLKLTKVANVL